MADAQNPDEELQKALDWACGNGAGCSKIQVNQPCYLPNTVKGHASYAFNSYYHYQKFEAQWCNLLLQCCCNFNCSKSE